MQRPLSSSNSQTTNSWREEKEKKKWLNYDNLSYESIISFGWIKACDIDLSLIFSESRPISDT